MARVIPVAEFEKRAFQQSAQKKEEKPQFSKAKRIAKKVGLGALALGGAAGVTLLAMRPELRKRVFEGVKNPRQTWRNFKERFRARAGGKSYYGGGAGGPRASHYDPGAEQRSAFRQYGLHDVKTKAEVRKKWHDLATQHHPDRGGDPEKMKHINATFDAFKDSPEYQKLAMARYWAAMASALVR